MLLRRAESTESRDVRGRILIGIAAAAVTVLGDLAMVEMSHASSPGAVLSAEALLDTDPPGPAGYLTLQMGRLRRAVGRGNGSLRLSGLFDARDQAATVAARVLADTTSVQASDGGSFAADRSFRACVTLRPCIRCRDRDRDVQVTLRDTDLVNVFRMTVTAKRMSSAVTGDRQPRGPIRVLFSDVADQERPGILSDGEGSGRQGVRCTH